MPLNSQRTYFIYADTDKERLEWFEAISASVHKGQMVRLLVGQKLLHRHDMGHLHYIPWYSFVTFCIGPRIFRSD